MLNFIGIEPVFMVYVNNSGYSKLCEKKSASGIYQKGVKQGEINVVRWMLGKKSD